MFGAFEYSGFQFDEFQNSSDQLAAHPAPAIDRAPN
jgi:hypothetical protein